MNTKTFFNQLLFFLAIIVFSASIALGNIYPPKPNAHFYGDANGDTGITGADIVQHNNYILSKPYTYDTLQPNNSTQAWNTCDMDSNRGCTGADNVILNSYLLSNGVSIGARPWELANANLSLTDNAAATWIPFNIDLHSTHATLGLSGRPGISVIVEIDPTLSTITGQLSGRECNPIAGSRDQSAAVGAQCALAVTQTNWPASAGTGPTESGTYGLQVMGDGTGDLNLKVYTVGIPGLDIPATSLRLTVSFITVPQSASIDCSYPGPNPVDEGQLIQCSVAGAIGTPIIDTAIDTCGGSLDAGIYSFTPGEGGARTCLAAVINGAESDSETVTINDVNIQPTISLICPIWVHEPNAINCAIAVDDDDVPADTLTCSLGAGDTCGGTITDCTNYNLANSAGKSPSCDVDIVVDDNSGQANSTATDTNTVIVSSDSASLTCPASANENASFSCTITASGPSVCVVGAGTTCTGVTLTGCTQVDIAVQGESVGPGSCMVQVVKGLSSDSKTITIDEVNQPPSIDFAFIRTLAGIYNTPGYANDVYVSGNYAYVADYDYGIQIIDVSNPTAPTLVGVYDTPGTALGVYVSGNYAYVADDAAGLQIIDITNPTLPTLTGTYHTPDYALGVYVSGNYAYVADYSSLQIIDIINPALPTLTGTYITPGSPNEVYVSGNYAYVADYGGLQIIDVTNPAVPIFAGKYSLPTFAGDVYVSGNYAYVTNYTYGLRIIDITNPTLPTLTGTYNTTGTAYDIYVSGNYAYVADHDYGLQIIDVSNPAVPILEGTYDTGYGYAYGVYVSGNFAYVADSVSGLQIINLFQQAITATEYITFSYEARVADSDIPQQSLTCSKNQNDTCGGNIVDCTYSFTPNGDQGGTSCVMGVRVSDDGIPAMYADLSNVTVSIFDNNYIPTVSVDCQESVDKDVETSCALSASDADVPAQSLACSIDPSSTCTGLTIDDCATVTVLAQGEGAPLSCTVVVMVQDSNTPVGTGSNSDMISITGNNNHPPSFITTPTLVGTYITPDSALGVHTSGDYAYVADSGSGLQIINVSNPALPVLAGTCNTPYTAFYVYVSGNYAYVADWGGFRIIDIANPTAPTLIGTYNTAGSAYDVYVSGNYAYVAEYQAGIQIIDVYNPVEPILIGTYNTSGYAYGVYVHGNYAYVADDIYGLQIINVSSPAAPILVGAYYTPGYARSVYVSDNYAYMADRDYGLHIINVFNPSAPIIVGAYDTPGKALDVYIRGNYAYVADYDSGLQIIDVSNPAATTLAGAYNTLGNARGIQVNGGYIFIADDASGLQIIAWNPPEIAGENSVLMTYKAAVSDSDFPTQSLTCSINPNDTCGGSMVDCEYSFTPGAGQIGTSCIMGLRVTDDGIPAMYGDMDITVDIY